MLTEGNWYALEMLVTIFVTVREKSLCEDEVSPLLPPPQAARPRMIAPQTIPAIKR